MARLTNEYYWNRWWKESALRKPEASPLLGGIKGTIRGLLGPKASEYFRDYPEYVLREGILRHHLTGKQNSTILEIGSAPGHYLVGLSRRFGLSPYGVDYSPEGAAQNAAVFQANGYDAGQVVCADAFGEEFQRSSAGLFDFVLSRGLIEHFDDPREVIEAHANLLKPGGVLIISIPNYRGLDYLLRFMADRGAGLRVHNLDTMRRKVFRNLFRPESFDILYCGYYGTCGLASPLRAWHRTRLHFAYILMEKLQVVANAALRLWFKAKGPETAFLSPFLLFIGRKK